MQNIAQHFNIPTLFFENPNIPGKTIIDPKGVNAKSSLYGNIQILNDYNVDSEEYEKFISEYANTKQTIAVNKKNFISIDNPYIVLDYLGFTFFNLPKNQDFSLSDRIIRKFRYGSLRVDYDKISFRDEYIFYPLQVSSDSQLLLNSDVSIMDALKCAYNESQKRGLKLIVKPHPKERDTEVIRKIMVLRKQMKFLLTNLPTMDLVRHCELLITINSTVGLEAMIMGKSVIFLGRTLYKDLSPDLIPRYICGYLADFPYTSVAEVPVEKIAVLLRKIEVKSV
jgi:capsular polysaccharide export protein